MGEFIINDMSEFCEALNSRTKKGHYITPWWRGQARQEWNLSASLYRLGFANNEISLTQAFRNKARSRHPNCPAQEDFCSWLFLMQHYRLPTRLLDWTTSSLVGMFFAVESSEYDKYDGALWALKPAKLNRRYCDRYVLLHSGSSEIKGLFREAFELGTSNLDQRILSIVTEEMDIRHLVQQSTFTVHGNETPIDKLPDSDTILDKYVIPSKRKVEFRFTLKRFGITREVLFPDLENLALQIASTNWAKEEFDT